VMPSPIRGRVDRNPKERPNPEHAVTQLLSFLLHVFACALLLLCVLRLFAAILQYFRFDRSTRRWQGVRSISRTRGTSLLAASAI